jgi:adenylate cyclase
MGLEIERKFLVAGDSWRDEVACSAVFRQGYLSTNAKATVRVRVVNDETAYVTIKGPVTGISRAEFEYKVPVADAFEILQFAQPHVVEKRRHYIPRDGVTWEVDVFDGLHAGLVLAEVELADAEQDVVLPEWIGPDVSADGRYANASLSRAPGVPARK